jgi:hypothetical protein
MEMQEKIVYRARLIADGIIRNLKWGPLTPREMCEALEVLADELVSIEHNEETPRIRARIEAHGLRFPQTNSRVQAERMCGEEIAEEACDAEDGRLREMPTNVNTRPLSVQNDAAHQRQVQQNDGSKHFAGLVCTVRNIDAQGRGGTPVHPVATREVESQRSPSDTRKQTCAAGATKDIRRSDSYSTSALPHGTGPWTWRKWSYNRVPPPIEEAVRDKFKQGWSKSKLAREFRLNRRTIIRICSVESSAV